MSGTGPIVARTAPARKPLAQAGTGVVDSAASDRPSPALSAMSRFVIEGGYPLSGTHATPGNKNAALPMIAAALLADGPVTISNLPMIRDVRRMLELVAATGAGVSLDEPARTATIDPRSVSRTSLPEDLCSQIRTSILLAGPLLARHGRAEIPPPGGDVIGRRRLDTHFDGLQALGASIRPGAPYVFDAPHGLRGCPYFLLDEASVTASENLLMAAALAEGETEFFNVACEPHVQDLCRMLAAMGADIEGIGTNRVRVRGVEALHGAAVAVGPDYIESGSYIAAAAATGGSVTIDPVSSEDFDVLRRPFDRLGVHWQLEGGKLFYPGAGVGGLRVASDLFGAIPKLEDGIWPAIPSDLLSVLIVLATQSEGLILFFEKMFESRLYFVDGLIGMGAQIVHCDPHRVVVKGFSPLRGSHLMSPDIRAGMAMIVAGLCAKGTTVIDNAESIDRGYEAIETNLQALGARIRRER